MTAVNPIKKLFSIISILILFSILSILNNAYPQNTPQTSFHWIIRISAGLGTTTGKILGPYGSATSYFANLQSLYSIIPNFALGIETGYIQLYRNEIYPNNHGEFGDHRFLPLIAIFEYSIPDYYIFLQTGVGFLFNTKGKSETPLVIPVQIGFEYPLVKQNQLQLSVLASGKQYFLPGEPYRNSATFNLGTSFKF